MRHSSRHGLVRFAMLPAAAAVALALAGCGGGGGGGGGPVGTSTASFAGTAIDAPVAGATITITAGAPLVDNGTVIGTVTANGQGGYSISVTLPSGSVPIFANAAAPNPTTSGASLELTSYLGQSDALSAAGALTTSNLPDLDISPVTTAALAVYAAQNGGSYASLTPALYASTLATERNDILAIAAAVKAVGDNLCSPATTVTSTTDLALQIAQNATLSGTNQPSTTLATAAAFLGGSCSALPTLQEAILADSRFAPELDLGDLIEANVQAVMPGTYELQSVIAETPVPQAVVTSASTSTSGTTVAPPNPAEVLVDPSVTIDASGNVTSSDNASNGKPVVSGTLMGNLLSLVINDPNGNTYSLRTKVASLPTALSAGGQAYNVQGGGVNMGSEALTMFSADLVPTGGSTAAAPQWDAFWNSASYPGMMGSEDSGVQGCSTVPAGLAIQPVTPLSLRFDLSAVLHGPSMSDDAFDALGACVAPTAGSQTSWTMWQPSMSNSFGEDHNGWIYAMSGATLTQAGSANGVVWNEASMPTAAPYVMEADNVTLTPSTNPAAAITGNAYYVLGSRSVVLSTTGSGSGTAGSAILSLQGRVLSQLSESSRNSSDGQQSMSQGDH